MKNQPLKKLALKYGYDFTFRKLLDAIYHSALLFASVGVLEHAGIKIPFFAFFAHDSGLRPKEPPLNMLLAMGIAAFLCIFVGTFPNAFLYPMLPNVEASYQPYTVAHVTDQYALLLFSALAFTLLMRAGLYPAEIRSTNLDTDWLYRKPGYSMVKWAGNVWGKAGPAMTATFAGLGSKAFEKIETTFSPRGALARGPLTLSMAMWSAVLLGVVMLVVLFGR